MFRTVNKLQLNFLEIFFVFMPNSGDDDDTTTKTILDAHTNSIAGTATNCLLVSVSCRTFPTETIPKRTKENRFLFHNTVSIRFCVPNRLVVQLVCAHELWTKMPVYTIFCCVSFARAMYSSRNGRFFFSLLNLSGNWIFRYFYVAFGIRFYYLSLEDMKLYC